MLAKKAPSNCSSISTVTNDDDVILLEQTEESQDESCWDTLNSDEQPHVKKRGQYRLYSIQFKMSVLEEVYKCQKPVAVVAEKYDVPNSTWEVQLRSKNKKSLPKTQRSSSFWEWSYPPEVDDEIAEWILLRRGAYLSVSRELIKIKARQLIKQHNAVFTSSDGWLQKFMVHHGISLRSRTSISQKLPA